MANHVCIGVGNCGNNVVNLAALLPSLDDTTFYSIDSVANPVEMGSIDKIVHIPITADGKSGSGRSRERGAAMFKYHESNGAFLDMYEKCKKAQGPIVVITSAAGGTGSGASVPLCETLIGMKLQVIPIIVCPNRNDPDAFHFNTSDLFLEMGSAGVETYSVFENRRGDADYEPVNREIVSLIEIILGKRYDMTDKDSIDDSDLDVVLHAPGRFIAVSAVAPDTTVLQRELTRKVFAGFQPMWNEADSRDCTIVTAYSLKSIFADKDFKFVFSEINKRLENMHIFDEYRNIVNDDNDGISEATIIITGLPRPRIKEICTEYTDVKGMSEGIKISSRRPNFVKKRSSINAIGWGEDGE